MQVRHRHRLLTEDLAILATGRPPEEYGVELSVRAKAGEPRLPGAHDEHPSFTAKLHLGYVLNERFAENVRYSVGTAEVVPDVAETAHSFMAARGACMLVAPKLGERGLEGNGNHRDYACRSIL